MADGKYKWYRISDFTGGRNAADDPLSIADNQVTQMRNGDTYRTRLFRKRGGAAAPSIGSAFTGVISSLIAHLPSNNPAAAELWGCDDAATPILGRMAAASTFSTVTQKDTPASGAGPKVRGASYNGKLFLAYDSAVDRMHVWDPNLGTPSVRRMGLATPDAPTAANTGAGTYPATVQYGRMRYRIKNGSTVVAQSEPSAVTTFTPSGSGTHARWTKAASISESETHWVLELSPDNVTFYEIAETAVGTTTYDVNTNPNAFSDSPISPVVNAYANATSWKYVIAAFNRVFGMGSHESGGLQSRVWYTPAKGASEKADDERVPNTTSVKNRLDLGEGIGGDGTGFAGPLYGSVYVFKYSKIVKLTPTGSASPAFDVVELSDTRGAIEQECIDVGEDARGRPVIYFLDSQVGPMVTGPVAPVEIGQGVQDQWRNDDGTPVVNLAATTKVGWVRDYPAKGQVWFAWATGANNDPNILAIYTKATGGWSVFDTGGKVRLSRCAVLFARTPGASMSRDKVLYMGYASANNTLLRGDTTDTDDSATTFQALVKSRPYAFNGGQLFRTTAPIIVAKPASGVTLTITGDGDFGKITRSGTVDLTLTAEEAAMSPTPTRVVRKVEGFDITDCTFMQYQIGDASAVANSWQIEQMYVPVMALDAPGP